MLGRRKRPGIFESADEGPKNIPVTDPSAITTQVILREIAHLAELQDQKFLAVEQRFQDNAEAVKAALAAVKEANSKSEDGVREQVRQIVANSALTQRSTDQQFADLKERLALMSGQGAGSSKAWAVLIAAIGAIGVLVAIAMAFAR